MNCKICDKDIKEHTLKQATACLKTAGMLENPYEIYDVVQRSGVKVSVNARHHHIVCGKYEVFYEDLDLELMRLCLTGPKVKAGVSESKKKSTEDDDAEASDSKKILIIEDGLEVK